MKALVTAAEVRTFAKTGSRMMTVNPGDIVTPAAWDEAKEIGVTIEYGAERPAAPAKPQEPQNVDAAFLAKVVNEVIACLQQSQGQLTQAVETDPCGLRLYRGDRLSYAGDQVKTAKALGVSQSAVSQWLSGSSRMSALVALRAENETGGLFKAIDLCPALRGTIKAA